MFDDIHDHMQEHIEAKAKREAEEKAEREAAAEAARNVYLERQREARVRENRAWAVHLKRIANRVTSTASVDVDSGTLTIDGVDTRWWIDRYDGRVSVGQVGHRTSYPRRKDGTYNYDAIARTLASLAAKKKAEQKRQAIAEGNIAAAKAVRESLGISEWQSSPMSVSPSSTEGKPVLVKVSFTQAMTAEEAEKLAAALIAAGIKVTY